MMGNPWSYRGHNLEWSRIRLLTKWDDIEMEYNASGMRTRKGDTYYELDGNNIISETTYGNTIRYYYGNGGIVGFRYNGRRFYYEKNLQGDIIGIYDEDANKLCEYAYDAWGNCTIKNDVSDARIGEVNSFRYRGYYYDSDLGLYYLKSRYYDAVTGRFINADEVALLGVDGVIGAHNMFAYCANNPVNCTDANGGFWNALKKVGKAFVKAATVVATVTVAVVAVTAAIGGTIASGGAGAIAIPAAVALAAECAITAAAVVGAAGATAVVAGGIGDNFTYSTSKSSSSSSRVKNPSKQDSEVFNSFERVKGRSYRTSGSGKNKRYYDWDYTHNDIEVYDYNGIHLGSMDPVSGEIYKAAVKGRVLW